jgi:hypothetical protein
MIGQPRTFGEYPPQLYRAFSGEHLSAHLSLHVHAPIECARVTYTKSQVISDALTTDERHHLSFAQKSERFVSEYEYRLVAIVELTSDREHHSLGECLEINLDKRLSYAELLPRHRG